MPVLLRLRRQMIRALNGWRSSLAILVGDFFSLWLLMWIIEPDNPLIQPGNYDWYFFVSASTMGYGDYFPKTAMGHQVAMVFLLIAVASGTALIAQLAFAVSSIRGKRKKGLASMDSKDHIVVLGYQPDRTRKLVKLIRAKTDQQIIVCAPEEAVKEHPLFDLDGVEFIRGPLDNSDTYARAALATASFCIIDVPSDSDSFVIAASLRFFNPSVHTAVALAAPDNVRHHFATLEGESIEPVPASYLGMLADIATTPGSGFWLDDVIQEAGNTNTNVLSVPDALDGVTVGDLNRRFGESHLFWITYVIANRQQVNSPPFSCVLRAGDTVGYLAPSQLTNSDLVPA